MEILIISIICGLVILVDVLIFRNLNADLDKQSQQAEHLAAAIISAMNHFEDGQNLAVYKTLESALNHYFEDNH